MALVPRESRENDRDTDDVFRRSAFSNERNVRSSRTPRRPSTFREDGSSIKLQMGGSDRVEGAVRDTPLRNAGQSFKRGFGGTDAEEGVIRNTPFSEGGTPLRGGFGGFDSPQRAVRRARSRPGRVRRPSSARKSTASFTLGKGQSVRQRQQEAARNLVTFPDKRPGPFDFKPDFKERDPSGDLAALSLPGIAGRSEAGVRQESPEAFTAPGSSVTDPLSGFSVPNQADPEIRAAFERFFGARDSNFIPGQEADAQALRDADPTRVAFQNRFFPSETLADAGVRNRKFRIP